MSGHALLIGCGTDGLTGVDNDLDVMERALQPRGFAMTRIAGPQATRAGILAAYRQLIDTVQPDEAAVVYYSGHGGRVQAPPPDTPGPSLMDLQFLVPTDIDDSPPGEFRGITSVELSVLLAQLIERTENATVILDCCHSAQLSRNNELRVKTRSQAADYETLRSHVEKLRAAGELPAGPLDPLGNRRAVRIVACAPEQLALEYQGMDGRPIGVLTESLALALTEAGTERVSWTSVMERIRRRVLNLSPFQRPEAEGPAQRFLFETELDDAHALSTVSPLPGGWARIPCAALLGVQAGDAFELTAPVPAGGGPAERIGELHIERLGPFTADGPVTYATGWTALPSGAKARRTVCVAPPTQVLLPEPTDPRAAELLAAVRATPGLRPVRPGEPWPIEVRIEPDGGLGIHDRDGTLPGEYSADAAGAALVCHALETLGRALSLRALAGETPWSLHAEVAVEWGTVHQGVRRPLSVSGATVHVGDSVYLSVRNDSAETVYTSLVDIGVSAQITILTNDAPAGRRLEPGREYMFGYDALDGRLAGVRLSWPQNLAPAAPRPETVLLLVSDAPQDVSVLAQRGVGRSKTAADRSSPLVGLLQRTAGRRDFERPHPGDRIVRYDAHTIDFRLDPVPAGEPA
jgi:Caspase domain